MKQINTDIKNQTFQNLYLIFGEERYLAVQTKENLIRALTDPQDTMNYTVMEGKRTDPGELIELARTLPFFAERRVILVEDSGFFRSSQERLVNFLPELPESTVLIFAESEVDKRGKLYKYIQKHGHAAECGRQKTETLVLWVGQKLKAEHKKITRSVMELFLSRTGDDMNVIANELEKLLAYTMDRTVISAEDVEAVCGSQVQGKIFAMIDAIAERNQQKALRYYQDLVMLREPPMRILALITRQFHILEQLKSMQEKGVPRQQAASRLKIPPFALKKNLGQASKFTADRLRKAFADCIRTDEEIKSGRQNDRLAVELLIIRYSA